MYKLLLTLVLCTFIIATVLSSAQAGEIEGSIFDKTVVEGNTRLNLVGVGLLRYWGIKAYKGAFYLEEGAGTNDISTDNAKRIELEYMRSFKGEDFGTATTKSLKKILEPESFSRIQDQIEHHNALYEDVKPGDRYSLTYIPGVGTELALNGSAKGVVEGEEFAAAIFSIWVGPKPISESFKKQILGLS